MFGFISLHWNSNRLNMLKSSISIDFAQFWNLFSRCISPPKCRVNAFSLLKLVSKHGFNCCPFIGAVVNRFCQEMDGRHFSVIFNIICPKTAGWNSTMKVRHGSTRTVEGSSKIEGSFETRIGNTHRSVKRLITRSLRQTCLCFLSNIFAPLLTENISAAVPVV